MSASLVGSEMCIRDRHRGPAVLLVAAHARRRAPPPSPGDLAQRAPLRGTVSYTHLTLPTICSV
eukprot:2652908-Alexandrium_andersonii.AAC.1